MDVKKSLITALSLISIAVIANPAPVADLSRSSNKTFGAQNSARAGSVEERLAALERVVEARASAQLQMQQQLQTLLDEVSELRGTTEVHNHRLEEILQQQRDIYQEIDRRLGGESSGGVAVQSNVPTQPEPQAAVPAGNPAAVVAAHDATCEAVDEAMRRFRIHPSRIVLAGYREGGTMAQRIALRDPERFAGVISLGGRIPQGGIRNLSQLRRRRMPMLWQWGQHNAQYTEENLKSDCRSAMSIGACTRRRSGCNRPATTSVAAAVTRVGLPATSARTAWSARFVATKAIARSAVRSAYVIVRPTMRSISYRR